MPKKSGSRAPQGGLDEGARLREGGGPCLLLTNHREAIQHKCQGFHIWDPPWAQGPPNGRCSQSPGQPSQVSLEQ